MLMCKRRFRPLCVTSTDPSTARPPDCRPLLPTAAAAAARRRSSAAAPARAPRRTTIMAAQPVGASPASLTAAAPPKPVDEPAGMEAEARLLEAFHSLPTVARGWAAPAATHDGVRLTLQLQQRNLAANSQRRYLTSFLLNEAVLEAGEVDASLPAEQAGALLYAPSPSGRRLLVARAGSGDASTGAPRVGAGRPHAGAAQVLLLHGLPIQRFSRSAVAPHLTRAHFPHASPTPHAVLELWDRSRLLAELHVPKSLHGSVYNDGWFGTGALRAACSPAHSLLLPTQPGTQHALWLPAGSRPSRLQARPGAQTRRGWLLWRRRRPPAAPQSGVARCRRAQTARRLRGLRRPRAGAARARGRRTGESSTLVGGRAGWWMGGSRPRTVDRLAVLPCSSPARLPPPHSRPPAHAALPAGKMPPALFVLDCEAAVVQRVAGLPEDASCGQPVWAPQGEHPAGAARGAEACLLCSALPLLCLCSASAQQPAGAHRRPTPLAPPPPCRRRAGLCVLGASEPAVHCSLPTAAGRARLLQPGLRPAGGGVAAGGADSGAGPGRPARGAAAGAGFVSPDKPARQRLLPSLLP